MFNIFVMKNSLKVSAKEFAVIRFGRVDDLPLPKQIVHYFKKSSP